MMSLIIRVVTSFWSQKGHMNAAAICHLICCTSELPLANAFVVQVGFSLISWEGRKNAFELHPIPCTNPWFTMKLLCYHMFSVVRVQRLLDFIAEDGTYSLPCRHLPQGYGWSMEVSYGEHMRAEIGSCRYIISKNLTTFLINTFKDLLPFSWMLCNMIFFVL